MSLAMIPKCTGHFVPNLDVDMVGLVTVVMAA